MNNWKSEFLGYLAKPVGITPEFEKAHQLKKRNIPRSIFKYRKMNENSISDLKQNSVWLSSPAKYNDPYDSSLDLNLNNMQAEMTARTNIEAEKRLIESGYISEGDIDVSLPPEQRHLKVLETAMKKDGLLSKVTPEKLVEVLSKSVRKELLEIHKVYNDIAKFSVKTCSFSEINNSIIMWSHYSQYHQGFCVEYSTGAFGIDDVRIRALYPVFYSNKLFDISPYISFHGKKDFNILFPTLASLHKSMEWEYEREWRLVLPSSAFKDDQSYPMPKPKAVYLGARIKDADRDTIKKICENMKIPLFHMRLGEQEFKMSPIEPDK